jgi:hypothetical protein
VAGNFFYSKWKNLNTKAPRHEWIYLDGCFVAGNIFTTDNTISRSLLICVNLSKSVVNFVFFSPSLPLKKGRVVPAGRNLRHI